MFRVTERTTRLVCRAAFLAGCVGPTVAVLAACLWQTLPFDDRAMERRLTATLGLHASIDHVETPRVNRLRLHRLRLHDPETTALIASVEQIDAGQVGHELVIWMHGVQVTRTGGESVEELLLRRVRQRLAPDAPVVRLVMSDLTFESVGEPLAFESATMHFDPLPTGAQARLRLLLAGDASPADQQPIHLRIFRRSTPDEGLLVEWQNTASPLPCRLIASMLPPELKIGNASTFAGDIQLEQSQGVWRGELSGRFAQLDFGAAAQAEGEPILNSRGSLQLDRVEFSEGRLLTARGVLETGPGDVDGRRLAAIADALQLRTDFLTDQRAKPRLAFDRLAFQFDLSGDGLRLAAPLEAADGALMFDAWGPLVVVPDDQPRSIARVIDAAGDRRTTAGVVDAERIARRLPQAEQPILETADRQRRLER